MAFHTNQMFTKVSKCLPQKFYFLGPPEKGGPERGELYIYSDLSHFALSNKSKNKISITNIGQPPAPKPGDKPSPDRRFRPNCYVCCQEMCVNTNK